MDEVQKSIMRISKLDCLRMDVKKLAKQNARYKTALEKIESKALTTKTMNIEGRCVINKLGKIATQALKPEDEGGSDDG